MTNSGFDPMYVQTAGGDDAGALKMDLSLRRDMEMLFRLLDWRHVQPAMAVEVWHAPLRILMAVERERVVLTLAKILPVYGADHALHELWLRANPEVLGGVPMRAFRIGDELYVSSTLPEQSNAYSWFQVYRGLRQLLGAGRTTA